jgi:hypothetical protein
MEKHLFDKSNVSRIAFDDPVNAPKDTNITLFYEPSNESHMIATHADNSCKFGAGTINTTPLP